MSFIKKHIPDFRKVDVDGWKRPVSVYLYAGPEEYWPVLKKATIRLIAGREGASPKEKFIDIISLHAFFNWFVEPGKNYNDIGERIARENQYIHGHLLGVLFAGGGFWIIRLLGIIHELQKAAQ